MKARIYILIFLSFLVPVLEAQVGINTDGTPPDPTAILDVKSSAKGLLPPRMTQEERNAIGFPAEGLLIFNTTTGCIDYFLGGSWKSLGGVTELVFQCGMKIADPRDGKRYNTIKIGSQCWMAENLNAGTMISADTDQRNDGLIEKFCYQNLESNCDIYGGLYQWGETVNYLNNASNSCTWSTPPAGVVTGICPPGWHLPCYSEWDQLASVLGGLSFAGGKMKERGTGHWSAPNTGADNASGFTARAGGAHTSSGGFSGLNQDVWFWSVVETFSCGAETWWINYNYEFLSPDNSLKTGGLAIRCLKDQ